MSLMSSLFGLYIFIRANFEVIKLMFLLVYLSLDVVRKTHQFIADLEWADYSPKITNEMLVHGASRNYLTPSCPKIYQEGLCIGKCPFFDGKGVKRD